MLPMKDDEINSNGICVALATGKLQLWRKADVMLSYPLFVPSSLAEAAADPNFDGSALNIVEEQFDQERFENRAEICRKVRLLLRQAETLQWILRPAFESLFLLQDRGKPLEDADIKTQDAARRLLAHELTTSRNCPAGLLWDSAQNPTAAALLATHALLVNHPEVFIPDPMQHKSTHTFAIRPLQDRKALTQVKRWIHASLHGEVPGSSDPIHLFGKKASEIIQRRRKATASVNRTGPPQAVHEADDVVWNANDLTILQFLRAALGSRHRSNTSDVFGTLTMYIAKRCGLEIKVAVNGQGQDGDIRNSHFGSMQQGVLVQLMTDLGFLSPWEDMATTSTEFRELIKEPASVAPPGEAQPQQEDDGLRENFDAPVYVIDDTTAKELDDGVAIEATSDPDQFWIHVHVADPTTALRPTDDLAIAAHRRHSSLYYPDGFWPMMPTAFGEPLGLRSGGKRPPNSLRLSAKMDMRNGKVSDIQVGLSRLKNLRVLSYESTDDVLREEAGPGAMPDAEKRDLKLLHKAAIVLEKRRRDVGGAFVAAASNFSISLDPLNLPASPIWGITEDYCPPTPLFTGFPLIKHRANSFVDMGLGPAYSLSKGLVSELMILSGRVAGKWAALHQLPILYRAQPAPPLAAQRDALLALRDSDGLITYDSLIRSSANIAPGGSALEPKEHFSMGIGTELSRQSEHAVDLLTESGYTRVTSPLRRYYDMLNHWQIKHVLRTGSANAAPFEKQTLLDELPRQMRMDAWNRTNERSSRRYWLSLKLLRGLQSQRGLLPLSEEEKREADEMLNRTHDALITIGDVRLTPTMHTRVRAQLSPTGLGLPVELKWDPGWPAPRVGDWLPVRISDVHISSHQSSVLVERA